MANILNAEVHQIKIHLQTFKKTNDIVELYHSLNSLMFLSDNIETNFFCNLYDFTEKDYDKWCSRKLKIKNYIFDNFLQYRSEVNQLLFDLQYNRKE